MAKSFFKYTRMATFEFLLSLLQEGLKKRSTCMTITAEERLVITLSYLSQSILSPLYVIEPNIQDYCQIAGEFNIKWNLHNCVGAIDGKHVSIQCPPHSGSEFYNYKKLFSVVLLTACDAHYTFTVADIGAFGSQSDGGVLSQSAFGKKLVSGQLPLPNETELPNSEMKFSHYFVGDPAFPLKTNLLQTYPGKNLINEKKIFNYRLSRGRVTIENAFGILVVRWRILRTTLNCFPNNAEKIVLATVALHNFLMLNKISISKYCPSLFVDMEDTEGNVTQGQWRNEVQSTSTAFNKQNLRLGSNNTTKQIFKIRDNLMDYFNKESAIRLQNKIK